MSNSNTPYNSDEEIATALQNTNRDVLNALYDRYACVLFRVFQKMTGDITVSEEILQSCFVNIWQNRQNYNPSKESLFVWIFQIAINTANDTLKNTQANQTKNIYVVNPDLKYVDWRDVSLLMAPIIFRHISEQEVTEKMGIPISELRQMLRKELNQSRGI